MKNGLVLEGGAMRGMYTVGALDVFMENGITFDCVAGVSAGASFGINLLSGQKGRAIQYSKRYNREQKYMGLLPLIKEGNIFSVDYAYGTVPRKLAPFDDERFRRSETPFYAVATNIETGKPEYIRIRSVFEQMDALRASCSMPFLSKPVKIDGKLYLDGGISDSVPFRWIMKTGCDKAVVILTRDKSYQKKPFPKIIANRYRRKYPMLAKRIRERHIYYNRDLAELERLEKDGKAFVIRPSEKIKIGRLERDPDKLQAVYDLGVRDAEKLMGDLKAFMDA